MAAHNEFVLPDSLTLYKQSRGAPKIEFPVGGRTTAHYHQPGTRNDPQAGILFNKREIYLDHPFRTVELISHYEEAMAHYDARAYIVNKCGEALGLMRDTNRIRMMAKATLTPAAVTGEPGGQSIIHTNVETDVDVLVEAITKSQQIFHETRVSTPSPPTAMIRPAQATLLRLSPKYLDRDIGGSASFASGHIGNINGVRILETNLLPNGVETNDPLENNDYAGDHTNLSVLITKPEAVGVLQLWQPTTMLETTALSDGLWVVVKMAMGCGVLDSACAIGIKSA